MPSTTRHEPTYAAGDEREDWYPAHRDEWSWRLEHGDPQFDTFDLLTPLAFGDVPARLVRRRFAPAFAARAAAGVFDVDRFAVAITVAGGLAFDSLPPSTLVAPRLDGTGAAPCRSSASRKVGSPMS